MRNSRKEQKENARKHRRKKKTKKREHILRTETLTESDAENTLFRRSPEADINSKMNAQMNVRARDKSSSRKRCFLNFGVLIFPVLLMLYLAPRTPLRLNQMARSHTLSHVLMKSAMLLWKTARWKTARWKLQRLPVYTYP